MGRDTHRHTQTHTDTCQKILVRQGHTHKGIHRDIQRHRDIHTHRHRKVEELNPRPISEKEEKCSKSQEQRLNLNRSWHKATLMRTIPRSSFKSYTKDLSLPIFELVFQHQLNRFCPHQELSQCYDLGPRAIRTHLTSGEPRIAAFQHGFWLRGVQP